MFFLTTIGEYTLFNNNTNNIILIWPITFLKCKSYQCITLLLWSRDVDIGRLCACCLHTVMWIVMSYNIILYIHTYCRIHPCVYSLLCNAGTLILKPDAPVSSAESRGSHHYISCIYIRDGDHILMALDA